MNLRQSLIKMVARLKPEDSSGTHEQKKNKVNDKGIPKLDTSQNIGK